MALIVIKQTLV